MKTFSTENIRNIVLAGHASEGKTTLAEAMLYISKTTERLGRIIDSNTVMDFDAEEKKRKFSVATSVAALEWKDTKVNLLDTPGLFDFAAGVSEALRAAQTAVIVVSGKTGFSVGAEKVSNMAAKKNKSRIFAVTKLDAEHTDFYIVLSKLAGIYGPLICPIVIPEMVDGKVESYINLIEQKAYKYENGVKKEVDMPPLGDRLTNMSNMLYEAVASTDDALMEKYFEGTAFTREEIITALSNGVLSGAIVPVYACSGYNTDGVDMLMDALVEIAPPPNKKTEIATDVNDELVEVIATENEPFSAVVFKTIADPFVGKLSYIKVLSGKMKSDMTVYNARTEENERFGKLLISQGAKQKEVDCVMAGDICAVSKLSATNTGDTLCDSHRVIKLDDIKFAKPTLDVAVEAKNKGDEEKIVTGIHRLIEEDPTLSFKLDKQTKQQILSGLGDQHIDVVCAKLKSKFGVEVQISTPKVAYKETIKHKVKVQGKHKKQSGGHGQFGDVWIEFEPYNTDGMIFAESVFGGSVPKNFFPAVEKGLKESIKKGVLAGFPVVGIKATLVDGSYHPVDSSEMAFKTAASLAFKAGMAAASPTLLEPIGMLKVYIPDDSMGDIIGDINKRRGRVLGMNPAEDKLQEIVAEVPMAEMTDFSTALRSITQGRGNFTLDVERYEEVPAHIMQKIVAEHKTDD